MDYIYSLYTDYRFDALQFKKLQETGPNAKQMQFFFFTCLCKMCLTYFGYFCDQPGVRPIL